VTWQPKRAAIHRAGPPIPEPMSSGRSPPCGCSSATSSCVANGTTALDPTQRRRDRDAVQPADRLPTVRVLDQRIRFEQRLQQFLDKQRNAVGAAEHLRSETRRQRFVAGHSLQQTVGICGLEALHRVHGAGLAVRRGRHEVGPGGDDEEHRQVLDPFKQCVQKFLCRGVDPMPPPRFTPA
jgi:hypothetical protein